MPETTAKLQRVRAYLKAHQLDGLVLATRANFAWLTGGGDNHVVSQSELGIAALYVTGRSATLLTNEIEAGRLEGEEPVSAFKIKTGPWTQPMAELVAKATAGKAVAGDDASLGLPAMPGDFSAECRASLLEPEIKRYRSLGRDCSRVIETVARQLSIGDSGLQVEAELARHLLARGIQPFVLLVAFDGRLKRYRHPVPTANHLRHGAMLVVCGQRGGQIASVTRLVHFGKIDDDLRNRHLAACRVEAALWQATVPGTSYGDALKAGIAQYKAEGFADEWKLHHQGGPTGYAGRDYMATPGEARVVQDGQAVAWNPSITGTKTEDTFIVTGDDREVITAASKSWPTVDVTVAGQTLSRPAILER